jgi:hypothetical protein
MGQTQQHRRPVLYLFCVCSTLTLSLSTNLAIAQVDEKAKTEKKIERQKEIERQTLILVEEVAAGAGSLKLPENRSYVLATTADLLWDTDEKRARALFWEALNTVNIIVESGSKNTSKSERASGYFAIFGLRQSLLRLVARHDAGLALELMRTTRLSPPENTKFSFPDDRELEQQIVAEGAARDPQRALQLARDSLARGFSFELLNLLYQLNEIDQEVGSKFAEQIIDKLKTEDIASSERGSDIAVQLVVYSRDRKVMAAQLSSGGPRVRRLKLDEGQRRELVELIANAALTTSANRELLYGVDEVRPELEEFAPERIRLLETKVADFRRRLSKEDRGWADHNALMRTATAEELLRAANKADSEQRFSLEHNAIVSAVVQGKGDSLRQVINNEIDDDSRRKNLLDSLNSEEIEAMAFRGDTAGLEKLLPQVRRKEDRARAMAQLAVMLEEKGDHDGALKMLGEAETLVKTDFRSETKTNALLGLLYAYALVDPSKAFVMIERTIDRANDEVSKAALVDKIVKSGGFKKGEILLQSSGSIPLDYAIFKWGKGVAALASADFARTKATADRFQRNELRLLARLLLAQALLRKEPKR